MSEVIPDGGPNFIYGCTDTMACNYTSDATIQDNTCEYPEINHDCDGVCMAVSFNLDEGGLDCGGECGGDKLEYNCGTIAL